MLAATLTMVGSADAAYRVAAPRRPHATSVTTASMSLLWARPRGARAYRVQYSANSSMRGARYHRFLHRYGRLTALRPSTRYYFRVRVINPQSGRALSRYTRRTSARTATPPPAPAPSPISWPSSTPAVGAASTHSADVRAGSFNLFGVNNDSTTAGEQRAWRDRRAVVTSQILRTDPDVVGLQEANQSTIYGSSLNYGSTQYTDLKGAINASGAHYALTNEVSYNCQKATSSVNCVPLYRGASNSTRILYNDDTLDVVASGSMKYAHQTAGKIDRYLAWAVFRVSATGGEFLFTDTHLDSYTVSTRVAQWNELIAQVNQLKNGRPVISVGDFNSTKFSTWAETMLPRMQANGYGDVLNQQYRNSDAVSPRAQALTNAWINSSNQFRRDVNEYSYDPPPKTKIGNNIDWVFASNSLAVRSWETVIDYNPSTLQISGVIPSDHNMVQATVVIP